MVVKADGTPYKVCPGCTPADTCSDHRHWLSPPPGALHIDDCSKRPKDDEK